MLDQLKNTIQNFWLHDLNEQSIYINDIVVLIRADMLLIIPIYMVFTLFDIVFGATWSVSNTMAIDTYATDWDGIRRKKQVRLDK